MIYSHDIRMKFDIEEKRQVRSRKRHMTEGIELPNPEKSERSEKMKLSKSREFGRKTGALRTIPEGFVRGLTGRLGNKKSHNRISMIG